MALKKNDKKQTISSEKSSGKPQNSSKSTNTQKTTAKNNKVLAGSNKSISTKTATISSSQTSASKKGVGHIALEKLAKIDHLPQNVNASIPFVGFMQDGIIETKPGVFTKCYKIQDINFNIASYEEQEQILKHYMNFLNYFDESIKFQITIFNHEIDKRKTIEKIRIKPKKDGLNVYRQEMNSILVDHLKSGNNSITQTKYLTVSIEDRDVEHAVTTLRNLDAKIDKEMNQVTHYDTKPLNTTERMQLLYDIYNQELDYRMATGVFNGHDEFDLSVIMKSGHTIKDVIGPTSLDFTKPDMFMIGDIYAQTLVLNKLPNELRSSFINELSEIPCNLLISCLYEPVDNAKALKMVRNQVATIEAKAAKLTKRNNEDGLFSVLPPELELSRKNAKDLMNDLTARDQKLFMMTFTMTLFSRTKEELIEKVKLVKSISEKHTCKMISPKYQHEFCFNTTLPLCRNDMSADLLYTTESASVFIPFNAQEISQENAVFYGLNKISKSMILCDRLSGANFNGLIFGTSGSGKSFTAKMEMVSILLNHPDAQVFVIDPQGEYYPMAKALKGSHIKLTPGGHTYVNPLDLDISEDSSGESDPVTMKSDFVNSMFSLIVGKDRDLDPVQKSLLDKCVRKIYRAYIEDLHYNNKTVDLSKCPTLSDLYQELRDMQKENYEAKYLADMIMQYAVGSFDTFAHRTNVETNARFVVYDTKTLGTGMKELGLHICTNDIWNRMLQNSKKNVYTWFYIDEFHLLLESPSTATFLKHVWKMARKWLGCPTGIMQNTADLMDSDEGRAIFNNTSFVIVLKSSQSDRSNFATLLHLSTSQLEYINNSDKGHGLLYNGKVTVPFFNDFPKKTKLYSIMTTSHDTQDATFG